VRAINRMSLKIQRSRGFHFEPKKDEISTWPIQGIYIGTIIGSNQGFFIRLNMSIFAQPKPAPNN